MAVNAKCEIAIVGHLVTVWDGFWQVQVVAGNEKLAGMQTGSPDESRLWYNDN
ncbi:hypothetical protein Nizo1840_2241 [Lactiplantibacillus plantarum]|mgnify:FL=1|jgi:hypothetical protein|uniref:hypothetical protein n=1 Tax=Lactiplantibacillus argentoratensis TaxID=271881 RepID=UPI0006F11FDA|nr:hypothetical protein [Lactiplantibacillus argentoratensis]KRL88884.1 hypothetical protein FD10_GL001934 [Lactiplantibacillus argentoratensis DSM 16365]KTF01019.1 hypothetical protein SF2A35B_2206 [Lactiplantibacillus plantarum]GEK63537.1 hypothetical protein LJA01_14400 [Lactobacillus japonicus]KZT81168.1 hypothetical protein Nizo1840_2241 [Lactiplantibacillus plantarum]KZT81329.1 hypothetical protein Nizo1839_1127 [Lactiplantibacillus plantarum]